MVIMVSQTLCLRGQKSIAMAETYLTEKASVEAEISSVRALTSFILLLVLEQKFIVFFNVLR